MEKEKLQTTVKSLETSLREAKEMAAANASEIIDLRKANDSARLEVRL